MPACLRFPGDAMLAWFQENNTTIYSVLGAALIVLALIWVRTQERRFLRGILGLAGLLVALILLDFFGPASAGRQMRQKIKAMAGAVKLNQMETITRHAAESFEYEGLDRAAMTHRVQSFINSGDLNEIVVWDFEPPEVSPGTAKIAFKAKPKGNAIPGEYYFRCVAQFVRDADGQWRMKTFDIFVQPQNEPVRIPPGPLG
jgi:hypothetical protein